jgi:hypothetical protein
VSLKPKEIDAAWNKLQMEITETGDRHAVFRHDGTIIVRTKRSFGSGKLDGNIPHFIRQQMKLNDSQFQDLINCPLTRDGYIEILREKGHIADP